MSGTLNKVLLIGHLGADPEVRRTQDGKPVVTFSIATGETWRDKASGERREITDWHRVVIFNEALCKVAEQYLKKGSKVYLEGAQKTRKWQDQSGADRYTTEVVLGAFRAELVLLDRADRPAPSQGHYGNPSAPRAVAAANPRRGASVAEDLNDEIPF